VEGKVTPSGSWLDPRSCKLLLHNFYFLATLLLLENAFFLTHFVYEVLKHFFSLFAVLVPRVGDDSLRKLIELGQVSQLESIFVEQLEEQWLGVLLVLSVLLTFSHSELVLVLGESRFAVGHASEHVESVQLILLNYPICVFPFPLAANAMFLKHVFKNLTRLLLR
jgi:hypothetical protein